MRNRRPAPHQRPKTTAELIMDLESRAKRGDPEADFEVPAEEWALLIEFARRELQAGAVVETASTLLAGLEPSRAG